MGNGENGTSRDGAGGQRQGLKGHVKALRVYPQCKDKYLKDFKQGQVREDLFASPNNHTDDGENDIEMKRDECGRGS